MKTFQVCVLSIGVATIKAETKAEAGRRARARDFDSYELNEPSPQITSLAEGKPIGGTLTAVQNPVAFRWPS
jgi:hypothetical protein